MLYVFHVDTGTMYTLDMNLAMGNVSMLQNAIAREIHIPEEKQVLLISGGESLNPNSCVGSYYAGTDTNPIFLFSKSTIEAKTPPSPSVHYGSDVDLQSQVDSSLLLPPTFETVTARTYLAKNIYEVDTEELDACEKLVHDQHLQQQGWAAVVANLEDVTCALRQRTDIFMLAYDDYLSQRESYNCTLNSVMSSLSLLCKIPLIDCLHHHMEEDLAEGLAAVASSSSSSSLSRKTLYEWISAQDPQHNLHDMLRTCMRTTEQLNQHIKDALSVETGGTLQQVENTAMKEIKGLEDRLFGLDQIMNDAKRIVQEQCDMSQSFEQNQSRATNLRDQSVLPDLCSSHKRQLMVMIKNHKRLRETKKKCKMAKEELSNNLHTRLRWVMLVQKMISDVDGKLIVYHENLKRLRRRLDILAQIDEAPQVYAHFVVEVVRRRKFSTVFTEWASSLSESFTDVYSEEFKRRQIFNSELGRHFLQTLFSGLEDNPPNILAKDVKLTEFDKNLPPISSEDISMLKETVPELEKDLIVPVVDTFPVITKEEKGEPAAIVTKHGALVTSDIEVLDSIEEQYLTAEHGSLSLGEQVAQADLDTNVMIRSDLGVKPDSLKEFPMPKSLSEDLTKQMRERKFASNEDSLHLKGLGVSKSAIATSPNFKSLEDTSGTSTSSGEQLKSTESESSSLEPGKISPSPGRKGMTRKYSLQKKVPETTLDMETSQEFTTTDYYIEESLPSSIADSPTAKEAHSKTAKVESSASVQKRNQFLEELVQKHQGLLSKVKTVMEKKFPELKLQLENVKQETISDNVLFQSEMKTVHEKLIEVFQNYETQLSASHVVIEKLKNVEIDLQHKQEGEKSLKEANAKLLADIDDVKNRLELEEKKVKDILATCENDKKTMKTEFEKNRHELEEKLIEARRNINSIDSENTTLHKQIDSLEQHLFCVKSECDARVEEVKLQSSSSIDLLKSHHSEEKEAEIEKIRREKQQEVAEIQAKVAALEAQINEMGNNLKQAYREKDNIEEEMTKKFQVEKENISSILKESYDRHLEEERHSLKSAFEAEKDDLISQHKSQTKGFEDEIKKKVMDFEVEMAKEKQKFEQQIENLREAFMVEKETAVADAEKLVEESCAKEMEEMKSVLSDEQEMVSMLTAELKELKNKHFKEQHQQTDSVNFKQSSQQTDPTETVAMDTQTSFIVLESDSVQTENPEFKQCQMQTELENRDAEMQTDCQANNSFSCQTETILGVSEESQTIKAGVQDECSLGTQTTIQEGKDCDSQTIKTAITEETNSETQTILSEEKECGSQTEKSEMFTKFSQTKTSQSTSAEAQTTKSGLTQEVSSETQTLAAEGKDFASQTSKVENAEKESQTKAKDAKNSHSQTTSQEHEDVESKHKRPMPSEASHAQVSDGSGVISLQEHNKQMQQMLEQMNIEKMIALQSVTQSSRKEIERQKALHEEEINSLISKLEKDKEDSLTSIKTSLTAGNQVSFNEAVSRAVEEKVKLIEEKQKIIEELQQKEKQWQENRKAQEELMEKLRTEKAKAEDLKTRALSHLSDKEREYSATIKQYESELISLRSKRAQEEGPTARDECASQSVLTLSHSDEIRDQKISELEKVVTQRTEEIESLKQKLMETSVMASAPSEIQDKVSIKSCAVGDLVLFCLDERHDHYVVFTIGTTLNFLHTDCLDALGLKTQPGETRKSWVLAEITEKEYCQAKKAHNRFRVPAGTKFYRVKAKPWSMVGSRLAEGQSTAMASASESS